MVSAPTASRRLAIYPWFSLSAAELDRTSSSLDIFFMVLPNKRRLPCIRSSLPINGDAQQSLPKGSGLFPSVAAETATNGAPAGMRFAAVGCTQVADRLSRA
jgi:hypothetical protein